MDILFDQLYYEITEGYVSEYVLHKLLTAYVIDIFQDSNIRFRIKWVSEWVILYFSIIMHDNFTRT